MSRFNLAACETLRAEGFTTRRWAQLHGHASAAEWRGDACGCTDDRCIGNHHDDDEECPCLPALIEEYRRGVQATERGREVWDAHSHAKATGAAEDVAHADKLLEAWTSEFYPGTVSCAFTSDGITYQNVHNDTVWTIFDASTLKSSLSR